MKSNIIVDLDNTLAQERPRRKHIKDGWDAYFNKIYQDEAHYPVQKLIQMLHEQVSVHILTDRWEAYRADTEQWLDVHNVPHDTLLMRPKEYCGGNHDDYCQLKDTHEVKLEMLHTVGLTPDNVLMVLDDNNRMVQWWRTLGFACFQVCDEGEMVTPEGEGSDRA